MENLPTTVTLAEYLHELNPIYSRYAKTSPWHGGATVIIADTGTSGTPRFRSVDANLILLPMLADAIVWTPEGIMNIDPDHPAVGLLDLDQMECGEERLMAILTLFFEGFYRPDMRRLGQLNEQFDSLVSRTADVRSIREAASQLFAMAETRRHQASQMDSSPNGRHEIWTGKKDIYNDKFTRKLFLKKPPEDLDYVDRTKCRFHRPKTVVELQRHLSQNPNARIIAGGTSLVESDNPDDFNNLISIAEVAEMQMISHDQDYWLIGAGVDLTRVGEAIGGECPAFMKALTKFGSRPVRNRATLGGYLAQASDIGQLAPLLMALDARVILLSPDGERDAPLSHFYEGNGRTIIREREFIKSIAIPRCNDVSLASRGVTTRICDTYTVGPRRSLCDPFVTGAFAVELRERIIAKAWIAYSGVSDRPVRARRAEESMAGKMWSEETVFAALTPLYEEIQITKRDVGRASADYRKQLVTTLIQKFYFQHPTYKDVKPLEQGATAEFAKLEQPFFDSVV